MDRGRTAPQRTLSRLRPAQAIVSPHQPQLANQAVAFLNESLGAASLAGLLLILAGSYVSTGGRFRRTPVLRDAPPPHGEADRALRSASAAEASGVDAR